VRIKLPAFLPAYLRDPIAHSRVRMYAGVTRALRSRKPWTSAWRAARNWPWNGALLRRSRRPQTDRTDRMALKFDGACTDKGSNATHFANPQQTVAMRMRSAKVPAGASRRWQPPG